MKSKEFTALLIRLMLGLVYLTAGFSKLSPHYLGNIIGPVDFGKIFQSDIIEALMTVLAFYQITAGALILSQRYSVAGLILVFPLALGIFIFTLVAGFADTPIINLLILLLLFYALFHEKASVRRIFKLDFKAIFSSIAYQYFPDKRLTTIAFGLIFFTVCMSFFDNPVANILLTLSVLLFTVNLFQFKKYLVIDKAAIALFFVISSVIINGILLNKMIPKAF